jgi:Family of unknown function (DUF6533)
MTAQSPFLGFSPQGWHRRLLRWTTHLLLRSRLSAKSLIAMASSHSVFKVDLTYALAPVAALTFCVYDVILSFNREVVFTSRKLDSCVNSLNPQVEHIWGSRWSSVKLLYFLVRYPVVIYLVYVFLYLIVHPLLIRK